MKTKINNFVQGYVCAVACLMNQHGSFQEAKDLLTCIQSDEEYLIKCGCDESDIETLKKNGLI